MHELTLQTRLDRISGVKPYQYGDINTGPRGGVKGRQGEGGWARARSSVIRVRRIGVTNKGFYAFKMSWKSFKFFDLEEVKDPDTNQPYDKLKVGDEINAADRRGVCLLTLINAHQGQGCIISYLAFCSGPEGDMLCLWQRSNDIWRYPFIIL